MKPIRLLRGFLTVGVWTFASRILGFIRDILIASVMGTGPVAEAFLMAFSLPNMFRRFFAEGAFNMAFVPMFSKKIEAGEDAESFARDAMMGLGTVLVVFTALAVVFMPVLVLAMASGFAGDDRFALAVLYGRICFVYILFISLAALLSGVLNATGRFAAAAAAPVLLNIILITLLMVGGRTGTPIFGIEAGIGAGRRAGDILTIGVVIAGLAQLALLVGATRRAGFSFRPRWPQLTPDLKRLAIIAAPAALAGGVVQINLLVGRQVASFFEGAFAWLSYADRLYQLPLGVVGIAIGIVLLPDLSRRLQAGDDAGGQNAFNRAGEMALALTVPAAVALAVIPVPLVRTLFERGAFEASDTAATALAVAVYGAGLPAFVLQKVLQPVFFAREDTKRPFYYALVALVVNAVVAIGLAPFIGFIAAAIGASVAGWVMAGLLWLGSRQLGDAARLDARFRDRLWRIVLASLVMGAVLIVGARILDPWLAGSGLVRATSLAALVTAGLASYAVASLAMGAQSLDELKSALRRA